MKTSKNRGTYYSPFTIRHNRVGGYTENKMRLASTTMCRRTCQSPFTFKYSLKTTSPLFAVCNIS